MFKKIVDFKIPTILGVGAIIILTVVGIGTVIKDSEIQNNPSNLAAHSLLITNIEDKSATITWQTTVPTSSYVTYGRFLSQGNTALDDRDSGSPIPRKTHHVTVKNLSPKTTYKFRLVSDKSYSHTFQFTTAPSPIAQNGFSPVYGTVADRDRPLYQGVVYLVIAGAVTQSAIIKDSGNFLIPLSFLRKGDLSGLFVPKEGDKAVLRVVSDNGQSLTTINLSAVGQMVADIKLNESSDLTGQVAGTFISAQQPDYDLNHDGVIDEKDYAIILENFGSNPKNPSADLNRDGKVDKQDLEVLIKAEK